MSKICPNCGKMLNDSVEICNYCGCQVGYMNQPINNPQNNVPNYQNANNGWNNPPHESMQNNQYYGGYNAPYGGSPQGKSGLGFAITSMVCGICSLVFSCIPIISIILSVVAVVFGILVIYKNKNGRGMAIAGLVCGGIGLIPALYFITTGIQAMNSINSLLK